MFLLIKKTTIKIVSVILTTALAVGTIVVSVNKYKPKDPVDKSKNSIPSSSYNTSKSQSNADQIGSIGSGSIKIENIENDSGLQETQNHSDNVVHLDNLKFDLENQETMQCPISHNSIEAIKDINRPPEYLEPLICSSSLISKVCDLPNLGSEVKSQNTIQNSFSPVLESSTKEEDFTKSVKLQCSLSKPESSSDGEDSSQSAKLQCSLSDPESSSDGENFNDSARAQYSSRYNNPDITSTPYMSVRISSRFDNQQQINTEYSPSSSSIDVSKKPQVSPNIDSQAREITEDDIHVVFHILNKMPIKSHIVWNPQDALQFIQKASDSITVSLENNNFINSYPPQKEPLNDITLKKLFNDSTSRALSAAVASQSISIQQIALSKLYTALLPFYNRGCINDEQLELLSKKLPDVLINFINQYTSYCGRLSSYEKLRNFNESLTRFIYFSIASEINIKKFNS